MNNKLVMIIGIVIFILIIGCTYTMQFSVDINNYNSDSIEVGTIIYIGTLAMPIIDPIVTSKFGYREPIYNSQGIQISGGQTHTGLDLCSKLGSEILAVKEGEVTYSGWQNGYGNCIEIKHIDEVGETFYSFYAHMRDNSLRVKVGDNVVVGQIIGVQGTTGNSTGDHLHFEIRTNTGSNKYAIDPAPYLFSEKEV